MFTALILACSVRTEDCQIFVYPQLLPNEEACMNILAYNIFAIESQGNYVRDYVCHQWQTDT